MLFAAYAIATTRQCFAGYSVFRWTNYQKDTVRSSDGQCLIWGSSPKVIRAT